MYVDSILADSLSKITSLSRVQLTVGISSDLEWQDPRSFLGGEAGPRPDYQHLVDEILSDRRSCFG